MPWAKTDAGRSEIQSRSAVNGRPQRNLLLLIDGKKSDEQLLSQVTGTSAADFVSLRELGLIAPGALFPAAAPMVRPPASAALVPAAMRSVDIDIPVDEGKRLPRFSDLSKTLTALISGELGLRGFTLTLAVERAPDVETLMEVADRVVQQIESRRGAAAAERARRALYD